MHTLEQLRSGQLNGITRLDLAADLTEFPTEIFQLADSLEVLNLSNNRLSSLPAELPRLHKLRVLFCSNNPFSELPEVLAKCSALEMVGFKSCQIETVSAAALPQALRWLILTDNRVKQLPETLGQCARLQKLMLAGNELTELPTSLSQCQHLELLRVAANRLEALPNWLAQLPRLAWLAYAGNPFNAELEHLPHSQMFSKQQLQLGETLGQGASGVIQAAVLHSPDQPPKQVAVKYFKGEMTSDGLPHCEMAASLLAGEQENLIGVIGTLQTQPDEAKALVLQRINSDYQTLAGPPSLESCTRDCYASNIEFSWQQLLHITLSTTRAACHLHQRGILHGDLYGHNLMINTQGHALLGDFGAASRFNPQDAFADVLQRIETRAVGILLAELAQRCADSRAAQVLELAEACMQPATEKRPALKDVQQQLTAWLN